LALAISVDSKRAGTHELGNAEEKRKAFWPPMNTDEHRLIADKEEKQSGR
jgi:hypothetical protein